MALEDILTPTDVAARSNGKVTADDPRLPIYVADALNDGAQVAPCLQSDALSTVKAGVAKRVLADVVLRRLSRDDQPTEAAVTADTWTMGPMGRTINFDTSPASGLSPLTNADIASLSGLCKSRKPANRNIRLATPTTTNPAYPPWPSY